MDKELQHYLHEMRRDFTGKPFNKKSVHENPIEQFHQWFSEAVDAKLVDPYAMSLSTVGKNNMPSTRIIYLRGIQDNGFIFYTNYNSKKGKDLIQNPLASLNFFWSELERQIRIEGTVSKIDTSVSDTYFSSRPRESQIGAWASNQSSSIISREELEEKVAFYAKKYEKKSIPRPKNWGGYILYPSEIEFWQGRPNRLHDRLIYSKKGNNWTLTRLCP